jgi:hypothetical protein
MISNHGVWDDVFHRLAADRAINLRDDGFFGDLFLSAMEDVFGATRIFAALSRFGGDETAAFAPVGLFM